METSHRHTVGFVRREFIQVGFSGLLGFGLSDLVAGRARAAAGPADHVLRPTPPRAKSVILVFLTGGLSHLDSFDMKPDAPVGIRGEFKPISTSVPGSQFCEHLPHSCGPCRSIGDCAARCTTAYTNHLNATHEILTGHSQPGAFFDKIASRDDYPCYASAVDAIRPRSDGVPSGVALPTFLMEGPLTWPGQHAGFLAGAEHDPWQVNQDPNRPGFGFDGPGPPSRLERRAAGSPESRCLTSSE